MTLLTLYYRAIWWLSVLIIGKQATWHRALQESDAYLGLVAGPGGA